MAARLNKNKRIPLVSVIVCTFNREDFLPGCLDSLASQDIEEDRYEVIVIDNGSSDRTHEIGKNYSRRYPHFYLAVEPDAGVSRARNKGLSLARGNYVAFIDDDSRARKIG